VLNLERINITGSRIIGAVTQIGHLGPKHHGIVLGKGTFDDFVYVAELRQHGYEICEFHTFVNRYCKNAKVQIRPNDGDRSDCEVANAAIAEINSGSSSTYDLLTNNCESFSNRAMYGVSNSTQVINTLVGVLACVGAVWYLRQAR